MTSRRKWKKQWNKEYKRNSNHSTQFKYNKWGYFFLIPFFLIFITCSLIPQIMTFINSFTENYKEGLNLIGPKFVGLDNYIALLKPNSRGDILFFKYLGNTLILWVLGTIPQLIVALALARIFSKNRLNIKGAHFFKTIMYMPNLIMSSAFAMLFFNMFSNIGPINQIISGIFGENATVDFFSRTVTVRGLITFMNFLMWFGNTMLVLMAGIMNIDDSVYEAAAIDGANSTKVFYNITLPLLKPILSYSIISSLLNGLQMYDIPQIFTNGTGTPGYSSKTIAMSLYSYLGTSKNYGMTGAISVLMFIISAILSIFIYKTLIHERD